MLLKTKQFCELAKEGKLKILMPMSKIHYELGLIPYSISSDKKDMVQCTVEKYKDVKIESCYKIVLKATDKRYGKENFYIEDLLGLIDSGYIKCSIHL